MIERSGSSADAALLRRLLARQFPELAKLPISPVEPGGWDNAVFRIGDHLVAKLPRGEAYAAQPARESVALDALAGQLPLHIPATYGLGEPSADFPHAFSIHHWVEGRNIGSSGDIPPRHAQQLADFLNALHRPAAPGAPQPSFENFWRRGPLERLSQDLAPALACLAREDRRRSEVLWQAARGTLWKAAPVWIHGDIAPANLLLGDCDLSGVIDFGLSAAGDPACDCAIAWLAFDGAARAAFLAQYLIADSDLLRRAAAWAVWKAVLILAGRTFAPPGYRPARDILESVLEWR